MSEPPRPRAALVLKAIVRLALGVALFAALVWWVSPSWEEIEGRIELAPRWLLLGLAGTTFATFVTAARWKLLSETLGATRLPYGVYFHTLALTRVVGQFLPMMLVDLLGRGAALRAAGSRSRLGELMTPVVLERLLDLVLPLVMLGWALVTALRPTPWLDPWLALALVLVLFVGLAIPLLQPMVAVGLGVYGRLRRLRRRDRDLPLPPAPSVPAPLAARVVGLGVLRYAGIMVQYWGAGAGFGVRLAPLVLLAAAPLAQVAGLVGITPGGLGLQEGGWAAALSQLGQDEASIVVLMAATRVMMVVNFGLLSLLSWPWRRARPGPDAGPSTAATPPR
ncbi:MAG: flippase-like domain-containing protein [Myxococcales bacterium]|nr:flippase-like domain-containing protein [Myxococcales bacterium]